MFNRDSILKSLNSENYYIDKHSLDLFLGDWNIEAIYEDEDGLEFYDDLSLEKIKRGISLKAQGYTDEQIVAKLSRMEAKVEKTEVASPQPIIISDLIDGNSLSGKKSESADCTIIPQEDNVNKGHKDVLPVQKNFTLDVSSQTLQMLAEAVAKKISDDITNSDMAQKFIEAGGYKRDNEILAKQVQELLEHNKELAQRIEILESQPSKNFWSRFWGKRK